MGMTETQILLKVQLPLARSVIIAGIRVATVWVIGTATSLRPSVEGARQVDFRGTRCLAAGSGARRGTACDGVGPSGGSGPENAPESFRASKEGAPAGAQVCGGGERP